MLRLYKRFYHTMIKINYPHNKFEYMYKHMNYIKTFKPNNFYNYNNYYDNYYDKYYGNYYDNYYCINQ